MSFTDNLRQSNNSNILGLVNPSTNNNYDGGIDNFANQVLQLHRDELTRRNRISDAMLQHQLTPINPNSPPLTTNPLVSMGLAPANTQIDSATKGSEVSPLDKLKLAQGQEKIDATNSKNQNDLGFKYSKEGTDSNIRQQRADVYDYKSKHPDHKFDFSGSTVKVTNPQDGTVYDTGVPTDKMSQEDKLQLMNTNGIMRDTNKSNMSLGNSILRDNNNSTNRTNEIHTRANETRETNAVKPNTNLVSNSQINQGQINKAQELVNKNPSYAPYIKLGKSDNGKVNGFSVTPVNGEGDPIYHEINNQIYGSGKDISLDDKSKSDKTKESDKKADPLGIR